MQKLRKGWKRHPFLFFFKKEKIQRTAWPSWLNKYPMYQNVVQLGYAKIQLRICSELTQLLLKMILF
jgi:hypothetical protein